MMEPQPADVICDPASGTCGFLVCAGEYICREHPSALTRPGPSKHFHNEMFSGYDFDNTMLRIGSMNMQLHGVQNPKISYRDSLAEDYASDVEAYSLILANPPFAGSLDYEGTAKGLLQVARTKKTELLFLSLFLRLLKPGGRAAVIVPDGVLFGSSNAHQELRRILVEEQKLDGIVSLPTGVFKPYSGVSTAILLFTKTNSGGTGLVWFYDLRADGYSLDDKRTPLLDESKLGALAGESLTEDEHGKNNLPDALARWNERDQSELERSPTEQSFCVPKIDIAASNYDLSINRYKEIVYDEVEHAPPSEILDELAVLEREILEGIQELKGIAGMTAVAVPLGELMLSKKRSVDPRKFPSEQFELFSIPAFDVGAPETVCGSEVGSSKQVLERHDVLLSRIVPHIRRSWVVEPSSERRKIGSSEWIVFRSDRFEPRYLRHVLTSDRFHQALCRPSLAWAGPC